MTRRMATAGASRLRFTCAADAAGERIKLTRYNKTVAIVIPKQDLARLEDCEKQPEPESEPEQRAARPRRAKAKAKQTG